MTLPALHRRAAELGRALARGSAGTGFVPTMGALHGGHLSLVARALRAHERVVVSVFVNPTQFGPREDFGAYPRALAGDRRLLGSLGAGRRLLLYAPEASDVYPAGFATAVAVGGAAGIRLEGEFRPGHLAGVATVVARLFALVRPRAAYFGLKDYQQYLVVRRLARDLFPGLRVVGCPTVREDDGLAMSSRNRYLDPVARMRAVALNRSLLAAAEAARGGERSVRRLRRAALKVLSRVPGLTVQYFDIADARTLEPLRILDRPARALTACVLKGTRLIDNLALEPGKGDARRA